MKILIGIDTGVNTGFAVAVDEGNGGRLIQVKCLTITMAMSQVMELIQEHGKSDIKLFIEDARLRTWFTGGREKAQGVGSIKRDAQIWEEWCKENGINYLMVHPKANVTKLKAVAFKKLTQWAGVTNEHSRDASMLVFGRFTRF